MLAADTGFDQADDSLSNTSTSLLSLADVTITLAAMWIGYKVLFDGKRLSDICNVFTTLKPVFFVLAGLPIR